MRKLALSLAAATALLSAGSLLSTRADAMTLGGPSGARAAGDTDLAFTTCHMCEAKWWFKDGELLPLASVIGLVRK